MNRLSTRNILYTPLFIGFLNLIAILYGLNHMQPLKEERALRFWLPSERKDENIYSAWALLKELKKKKQVEYILKGDTEDDSKINAIRFHALQIKYSCDTNTVIKIHLRDNITYGETIELFSIMLADKHKRYMLYENNLYIIPPKSFECVEEERILPGLSM